MPEIIDGKKISQEIRNEVALDVQILHKQGIHPHLTVILVGDNPASQVYVRMKGKACEKAGIISETLTFPSNVTMNTLLKVINELNTNPVIHGILVQLPLPSHIDESIILESVLPAKDVDGFHPVNMGKLAAGLNTGFFPATPAGILELLIRTKNNPDGKHVVIIGRSNIVGKPLGLLLLRKQKGGNATVTFCHSQTQDIGNITRTADILIAAVGRPEMIKRNMVKNGAVVIDVGINRVDDPDHPKGYRLVGDVDFKGVSDRVKAITPVPGGVGPMTIALLLKNTVTACKRLTELE